MCGSAVSLPHASSATAPGVGDRSVSAPFHHSRMCSGLLITSNTISGDASTWISRSMLPNSMASRFLQRLVAHHGSLGTRVAQPWVA